MDAGSAEDESVDLWTVKSCGPDAPTLAPRSRVRSANDSGKKARSLGRARSKRKPLRGECRVNRCDRGDYARALFSLRARLRAHRAPGIPCAL